VHARRLLQQSMSTVSLSMCMLVVYSFCVLCVCVCVCVWEIMPLANVISFHNHSIITTPHTLPSTRSSSLIPDRLTQCIPDNKMYVLLIFLSLHLHTHTYTCTYTYQGGWVLLQKCHLGLDFMDELLDTITEAESMHDSCCVWITTEAHPKFSISLLQVCVGVYVCIVSGM